MNLYGATSQIAELKGIFEQMTKDVQEYSIVLLDEQGNILTWNKGSEKIKGYTAVEIIGQHFSIFYLPADRQANLPLQLLSEAREKGSAYYIGRRIRKNGTVFWGRVEVTAIKDENDDVIGFTKTSNALSSTADLGNFWFDNEGILHVVATREPHTAEKMAEFRASLNSVLRGQRIFCVADIRDAEFSYGGSEFYQPLIRDVYKAIAYISGSPTDKNTEMALKLVPEGIPTKVVRTREEGAAWVKQLMK